MTNKELEKRIVNLEKWCETFADFHGIDPKRVCCFKEKELSPYDFKIGDRVQFEEYNGEIVVGTIRDICMDKATIEQKTEDGVGVYIMGEVHLGRLKPATDEPKCKFKVGDKVKVKGKDKVGEITQYHNWLSLSNRYLVEFTDESYWYTEQDLEPYTEPRWTFTDDEKVILRNLPEEYKWIARDENGDTIIFADKPKKRLDYGCWRAIKNMHIFGFNHLFQSIKWTDDQACEFRKYI